MAAVTTPSPSALAPPPVPVKLEDTGLPTEQVEQLLVKTLYAGELTGLTVADRMKLPYNVLEPLFVRLRTEQIIEVRGASSASTATFRYALTDKGRERALQYMAINQYTGAAPVPLAAYVAMHWLFAVTGEGRLRAAMVAACVLIAAPLWGFRTVGTHYELRRAAFVTRNDWVLDASEPSGGETSPADRGRFSRLRGEALRHRVTSPSFLPEWGERYWVE